MAINEPELSNELSISAIQRLSGGAIRISGLGVPAHAHTLAVTNELHQMSFMPLTTITPDATGAWHYDDTNLNGITSRFYQLTFP